MDPRIEACARAAHEMNRAYCIAIDDPYPTPWEGLPEDLKASVRAGVEGVLAGNDERSSHAAWMAYKLAQGWRRGPVKSWEDRTHPNLVPYSELPRSQQQKDGLFVAAVRTMAAALGMKVVFPAAPARNGNPALPRREIDWSSGAIRDLPEGE